MSPEAGLKHGAESSWERSFSSDHPSRERRGEPGRQKDRQADAGLGSEEAG